MAQVTTRGFINWRYQFFPLRCIKSLHGGSFVAGLCPNHRFFSNLANSKRQRPTHYVEASQTQSATYLEMATEALKQSPLSPGRDLDEWFRDFHFLFQNKCYKEIADQREMVLALLDLMRPTEICMVVHHYSECESIEEDWWKTFSSLIRRDHFMDMTGRDIASLFNSLKKVKVPLANLEVNLLEITSKWIDLLDIRSAAVAVLSFSSNEALFDKFAEPLSKRITKVIDSANSLDIVMCCYDPLPYFIRVSRNYCKNMSPLGEFNKLLVKAFYPLIKDASGNHLATVAWDGASLDVREEPFWQQIIERFVVLCERSDISHYQFAHITDACAHVDFTCDNLKMAIQCYFEYAIERCHSNYDAKRLFAALYFQGIQFPEDSKTKIASFLDTFLSRNSDYLLCLSIALAALCSEIKLTNWNLLVQNLIGNERRPHKDLRLCALYCCAYSEWKNNCFTNHTRTMIQRCESLIEDYNAYEISMFAFSCASLQLLSPEIWSKIIKRSLCCIPKMDAPAICILLCSFYFVHMKVDDIFTACKSQVESCLSECSEADKISLALVFHQLDIKCEVLMRSHLIDSISHAWERFLWRDAIFKRPLKYLEIKKTKFLHPIAPHSLSQSDPNTI